MAREEIIHAAAEGVRHARSLCEDVEFSPEDASRTELEFLAEVVEAAIAAGATTINIPDTVGYAVPEEYFETFQYLKKHVRSIDKVVLSVHCHDDLGMAVANSLAAVRAGARQVECTINGIGERAGNCSLEEVVMALRTREGLFGLTTGIDTRRLYPTSRLLSSDHRHADPAQQGGGRRERVRARVGHPPARHAAAPLDLRDHAARGRRALAQQSRARQAQRPPRLARARQASSASSSMTGAQPGLRRLQGARRQEEGAVRRRHRGARAEDRKRGWRRSVAACSSARGERLRAPPAAPGWCSGTPTVGSVEVTATGDGPVDAAFKAVENATGVDVKLRKFEVRSVSVGEDAQGEAVVTVEYRGRSYRGTCGHHGHRGVGRASFPRRRQPDRGNAPLRRPCRERAADRAHRGGRGLTTGHA